MSFNRQYTGPNRFGQQRPGQAAPPPSPGFQPPSDQETRAIILQGDARTLVTVAERVGRGLADAGLTTSQIRGVFGSVRLIQMKWPVRASKEEESAALRQLLLLKPKLAYQSNRDERGAVRKLMDVLSPAIDLVASREQFVHLVDYFEAILAYHKAAGGKDDDRRR